MPDQFRLKRLEEAFRCGIVVTVALPAHRWLESVVAQKLLIIMCAVLRPTIGVMNAAWWWSADRNRHVQRPECQILFYAVTDGPAHHTGATSRESDTDGSYDLMSAGLQRTGEQTCRNAGTTIRL